MPAMQDGRRRIEPPAQFRELSLAPREQAL
jgi:hypothetical protein